MNELKKILRQLLLLVKFDWTFSKCWECKYYEVGSGSVR